MKKYSIIACLSLLLGLLSTERAPTAEEPGEKPLVELAILLDSSSSMGGLIQQAQTHLWKIVNEFALAKKDGITPDLYVALYEYGNNNLPAADNYLRQLVPLTTNLDLVSERLFAVQSSRRAGGDEWCGTVIQAAVDELKWSKAHQNLKVIIIAGNEPFTNGPVDYRQACKAAISKGIMVNTIHCGPYATGASTGWKDGARLADGCYTSIDQNRVATRVITPEDEAIRKLEAELNGTYIPYGREGKSGRERQQVQDRLARKAPASGIERAVSKGSLLYDSSSWDLVDAVLRNKVRLEELKKEDLPQQLRELSLEKRKEFVEDKAKERKRIQADIQKLSENRRSYIEDFKSKRGEPAAERTLDEAVIEALEEQAEEKGIELKPKARPRPGRIRRF